VEMELSKPGKTAIVVVQAGVGQTPVVILRLANSSPVQSVIPATRIVVHKLVNLPLAAPSAGLVQGPAILRRLAVVLLLLARRTLPLPMVCSASCLKL
jgi:hypothetical protein